MSNFYRTEIEIWAGFGPVGNAEKKFWADYEQFLRAVFSWAKQIQALLLERNFLGLRKTALKKIVL